MALFKDKFDNTLSKLKQDKVTNEILSKKAMLEKSANQEIGILRSKINEQFNKLGEFTYNQLTAAESAGVTSESTQEFLGAIGGLLADIATKEEKLQKLLLHCDEELEMLNPSVGKNMEKCSKCGEGYTAGVDMFCKSCGNKLG